MPPLPPPLLPPSGLRRAFDLTLFTTEDLDVCLARRLRRDIVERGRTVQSVLDQYVKFVKPGFTNFIRPSMSEADFIIPRAKENEVAIDLFARFIGKHVLER